MDFLKTLTHSLSALDQPARSPSRQVMRVENIPAPPAEPVADRRVQPDRRRRQQAFKGPDRRRKCSRRRAMLLHPRTGEEISLEDRRGRNIRTSA